MLFSLVIIQLGCFILLYLNFTEDYWKLNEAIYELPVKATVISRVFVTLILHMIIDKDFIQSLQLMKYALNHFWKFRAFGFAAFGVGLLQFSLALFAEYISFQIILSTGTYVDAVKDFIALMVVNDFDNFFFAHL